MSSMRNGIWGAVAVTTTIALSATFGAMQFASGHDLTSRAKPANISGAQGVNRAAKADRTAGLTGVRLSQSTQTISFRVDRLADTSVMVRIPRQDKARNNSSTPGLIKSEDQKATVACEPTVSVLTDIAKRLAPGRCVT
jgi:hypothetical protein